MSESTPPLDDAAELALLGASYDNMTPSLADLPRPFTWSQTFLIVFLGSLSALGPLTIDMYLPAFPAIARDLACSVAAMEHTQGAYFLGLALGQLVYGPLADRWGRKRPLYFGLILFVLASIGCALSRSVLMLTALRFMQALGGCAEMVIARAIVRDRFESRDAAKVFSTLMLVMGLAPILAPQIGGWLVTNHPWRLIFWFLATFAGLCLASVGLFLPETLVPAKRHLRTPREIASGYMTLLSDRHFMAYVAVLSLVSAALFAYVSGSPFVLMNLYHIAPNRFGLFFGINAVGLIGASQINRHLVGRISPAVVLRAAVSAACVDALVLILTGATGWGGLAGVAIPLFLFLASLGFIYPNSTALAMAPHGKAAGSASALLGAIQFIVSGLGVFAVSVLQGQSAWAMCSVIAFSMLAAWFAQRTLVPAAVSPAPSTAPATD